MDFEYSDEESNNANDDYSLIDNQARYITRDNYLKSDTHIAVVLGNREYFATKYKDLATNPDFIIKMLNDMDFGGNRVETFLIDKKIEIKELENLSINWVKLGEKFFITKDEKTESDKLVFYEDIKWSNTKQLFASNEPYENILSINNLGILLANNNSVPSLFKQGINEAMNYFNIVNYLEDFPEDYRLEWIPKCEDFYIENINGFEEVKMIGDFNWINF